MNHIMLDLETLDTADTAVVLSIGAVAFDPYSPNIGNKFYVELTGDISYQQNVGRTISGETVKWWLQQNLLARQIFASTPADGVERVSTYEALARFELFLAAHGDEEAQIWGNGADFDNKVLRSLYESMGALPPWSFRQNRCYRTMKNLGIGPLKATHSGVAHNALDDAVAQAQHLQEIFACVATR